MFGRLRHSMLLAIAFALMSSSCLGPSDPGSASAPHNADCPATMPEQCEAPRMGSVRQREVLGVQSESASVAAHVDASYTNLVANPSFEFSGSVDASSWDESQPVFRVDGAGRTGSHCVVVYDTSAKAPAGVVTPRVPAVPGQVYTATAWAYAWFGSAPRLYLQFYDGLGARKTETLETHGAAIRTRADTWSSGSVSALAPPGARYVDVLIYSTIAAQSAFYVDDVSLVTGRNLLVNGSFDDFDSNSSVVGWSPWGETSLTRTSSMRYDGTLALQWADSDGSSHGATSSRFPVYPGQVVRAGARAQFSGDAPSLYLRYFADAGGRRALSSASQRFPVPASPKDWSTTGVTGRVPSGARFAEVLVYSCLSCAGRYTIDDVEATTDGNLLLDGDFEEDASEEWSKAAQYTDIVSTNGGRALRLEDRSAELAAAVRSEPLPVVPGESYVLTGAVYADANDGLPAGDDCQAWLAVEFYPSLERSLLQSERVGGSHVAPVTPENQSLSCVKHGGRWVSRRLSVTAPKGAYAARVLLYSPKSSSGRFYFDGVRFGEAADITSYQQRFVCAIGRGRQDGRDIDNCAVYNSEDFWEQLTSSLQSQDVKVIFAPEQYRMVSGDAGIALDWGSGERSTHRLLVQGAQPAGATILHAYDAAGSNRSFSERSLVALDHFDHVTFRDIAFSAVQRPDSDYRSGNYRIGYALRIRHSNDIELQNVSFYDIRGTQLGGFGPQDDSSEVLVRDSYFARLGYDSHAHFSYCMNRVYGLQFVNNRFEDINGHYVRFRNDCDDVAVVRNRFQSTGTYFNSAVNGASKASSYKNPPFITWSVFNDGVPLLEQSSTHECPDVGIDGMVHGTVAASERDPIGDEWLGRMHAVIESNRFEYLNPSQDDDLRYVLDILVAGLDPEPGFGSGAHVIPDVEYLTLLDAAAIGSRELRIAGADSSNWIKIFSNDYLNTRDQNMALLRITTRDWEFWNAQTQSCDSTRLSRGVDEAGSKRFTIDNLVVQ
jgi:hypothetical protein